MRGRGRLRPLGYFSVAELNLSLMLDYVTTKKSICQSIFLLLQNFSLILAILCRAVSLVARYYIVMDRFGACSTGFLALP